MFLDESLIAKILTQTLNQGDRKISLDLQLLANKAHVFMLHHDAQRYVTKQFLDHVS